MKTLVVVSALVALAIAAPALPGENPGLENPDRTQARHLQGQSTLPDILKRERKSPSEISSATLNSDVQHVHHHHIEAGVSTHGNTMGRSFGLKKPLIVKKKYGYRLYRDSEEEKAHADSHETCGRQVKVKLCDDDEKFKTTATGSTHERADFHTTEDDVKHSIKMAKEAVENLQRDLKKIEMKTEMKSAHESQSDAELHEDIEVARQALKHIHENFGNLESLSLHATTTRDSEAMQNVHLTIAKTEEERLAQWKEAMENIQKNVEIARNIEDSFKTAEHQESLLNIDQSEPASTSAVIKTEDNIDTHPALTEGNHVRLAENADLAAHLEEKVVAEEKLLDQATNKHLSEHQAREEQNTEDDMKTAPSEMIETHLDNSKNQMSLRSESHKIHDHGKSTEEKLEEFSTLKENINYHHHHHHHEEKSADLSKDMLMGQSEHHITQLPAMKVVEEETETKVDMEKDAAFKTSENIPDVHTDTHTDSANIMKPLTVETFSEHQRSTAQVESEENTKHHEMEKSVNDMVATDDMIDFLAKSADNFDQDQKEAENVHKEHIVELEKAAEDSKPEQEQHLIEDWENKSKEANPSTATEIKDVEILDHVPRTGEDLELSHVHNVAEQNENVMLSKSADHGSLLDHQKTHMIEHEEVPHVVETVPTMKAAEEHLHHLKHMHNSHWAHENSHLDHLSSMKAAEDFKKEFEMTHGFSHGLGHGHGIVSEQTMDHLRNTHLADHGHMPGQMGVSHEYELSNHMQSHSHYSTPSRYHNTMPHTNLHEMTGMGSAMHPNFHPSMREAMDGFGSDHMFRWKPTHESARVAYGSGLSNGISSGGAGAVGVFPNANTGGCGIPLLLSCSPSVVSGSLAKAHSSSYSAPSYRTEDDFGFHNKRDIKKTNDIRTTNSLRTPSIVKQKNSIILENKM